MAVALVTLPSHIQGGDAGEFATIMLRGGVPHPSGYPWMRVLGAVARLLEGAGVGSVVAASLPSAFCGVAAWIVIQRLCREWGHPLAGSFVVMMVASSGTAVLHINDCEVWGPLMLLAAIFMKFSLGTKVRSPLLLGFLLGLTTSHHLTGILLIPLAVGSAWPEDHRHLVKHGVHGLVGSTVGLLPLLTLALGAGGAWRWGDTRTIAGWIRHVTRGDYGVFQLSLHRDEHSLLDLGSRAVSDIGESFSGGSVISPIASAVFLALVIFIAAKRWRSFPRTRSLSSASHPRSGPVWGLCGVLFSTTLGFPAAQNIDPLSPFGSWILERFDLLAFLVWAPVFAVAAAQLTQWTTQGLARTEPQRALAPWLMGSLAVTLMLSQGAHLLERGTPADESGVQAYAQDLLATPRPGRRAIVFGTDDHRGFPVLFMQQVGQKGRDVLYVDAQLLTHAWYRSFLRKRWPDLPDVDKPLHLMSALWRHPTLAQTPIYIANIFSRPASKLQMIPEGMLLRVIPPVTALNRLPDEFFDPNAIAKRHLAALGRYIARPAMFGGRSHPRAHPWSADLWHRYAEGSQQLSARLRADDLEDLASEIDRTLAGLLGPAALPATQKPG